ncbi:hypothetical protein [Neogemmobacter tilapiae]|uniref:DUF3718 domain-containing protein n=1 Tax=Neogemmobacter tilapiae TaxID=875041 RepID=A0A918TSL9_9RHOB|nr:hypothetical protein [Gemmobacter tilapiae]GHC58174.1 hypothetical protein GCM10007315_22180 [Gemmobacter tilapiae]
MIARLGLGLVMATLWSAPALAQDFSDRELMAVVAVFQAKQCVLGFEEAPTLIQAAGIDAPQMGLIVAWLIEGEHAVVKDDGKLLVLGPGMCKP